MSELTITLLRLGYLALLWVLVLFAIGVLRRDLYGTRITDRRRRKTVVPAAAVAALATEPTKPETAPTRIPRSARSGSGPGRLVVTEGPLRGTIVPLGTSSVLIGRAPGCTLVLDDDYSSSRHARIFPQGGQWFVEDLGSTNGTYLDGQRVTRPVPAEIGGSIRIGRTTLNISK